MKDLIEKWQQYKADEDIAKAKRREVEDQLAAKLAIAEGFEGTVTSKFEGGVVLKVEGRLNRKVDSDKVQEIAAECGLSQHLSSLFRWKPEINATAWKNADEAITRPLLAAITTTPGRPSFSITIKE